MSHITGTYNIIVDYFKDEKTDTHNTLETAQELVPGLTVRGLITAQDDRDTYKYVLTEPVRMTVNVTRDTLQEVYVRWLDVNGTQIRIDNYYSSSNPYNVSMDFEAGIYYIEIVKYGSYTGTYNLRADFTAAGNNEIEPNETFETAQLLALGETVKGFISYTDKADIYRVELWQPGQMTVNVTRSTLQEVYVEWIDVNGTQIRRDDYYSSNPYNNSVDLETGIYYIKITQYGNYTGTYNLRVDLAAAGNNEIEPNETRVDAQFLASGQAVRGFISHTDKTDMYRVQLTEAGKMVVNVTRDTIREVYVTWLDVNGTQIKRDDYYSSNPYNTSVDLAAGIYYIEITPYSNSYTGTYNMTVSYPAKGQPPTYTVTFDANGGAVSPTSAQTDINNGRLKRLPIPTRVGYMFLGWFTQPDGGTQVTASTAFAANSTIYAHWIKTGSVNEIKIVISPRTTVAQIIENFGFVSGTTAVNKDGTAITGSAFVGTGSTINLTNGIKIITIIYGDVNGDGDVASGDPVALARYIAEIENLSSYGLEAADVNGDGKVNILDLIRLSRYMAGLDMLPLGQP